MAEPLHGAGLPGLIAVSAGVSCPAEVPRRNSSNTTAPPRAELAKPGGAGGNKPF